MNRSIIPLAVQLGCTAAVGGYLAVQLFRQRGWRWLAAALLLAAFGAAGALAGYGWLSLPVVCITAFLLVHLGDRLGTNRVSFRFAALFVLVQVGLCLLNQNGTAAQGSWTFSLLATAIFFLSENNQNFLRKSYEQSMMEYQNKVVAKQVEEVQGLYMTMRGWRHDYHNHLQALKGQLEAGQVDRAIAYLEQLDRSLQTVDTLLKTGNVTVDAILSAKLAQARAAGIAVTAEANLPPELSLTDLELSIVIGNLLDNAIEGCRSAAGEKFLRLSLRMKGDMLYFYLLNSAGKKQKKVGSLFRTGKTGAHGFGLHRAEAIVKQHGGWVKYNSEDGAFTSEFLVPAAC